VEEGFYQWGGEKRGAPHRKRGVQKDSIAGLPSAYWGGNRVSRTNSTQSLGVKILYKKQNQTKALYGETRAEIMKLIRKKKKRGKMLRQDGKNYDNNEGLAVKN